MIEELNAIKAALPEHWPVHVFAVPGVTSTQVPPVPYVVLETASWGAPDEVSETGEAEELDTPLRVKVVGKSGAQVVTILGIIRGVLSPNLALTRVPLGAHRLETLFLRSEFVQPDTSVRVIESNTHPVVGVDSYRMTSQPIPA